MRKKIFPTCFMSVIAVMCFVFLAPAFADMKNVDEAELAKTNASVTGASEKDQIFDAEKNVVNPETLKVRETINKDANISPSVNNTIAPTSLDMNVNGQTTLTFGFGGATSNVMGGASSPRAKCIKRCRLVTFLTGIKDRVE